MAGNAIAYGLNPGEQAVNHDSDNPLNPKDITTYSSHSSKIQDYLNMLSLNKLQRNRIHSFDFDNELPATIFILPESTSDSKIPQSFTNFMLTSVQEDRREKFQIFETFGDPALFFFDKKTPIYSFSGFLVDSEHQDQTRPGSPPDDKSSWSNQFRNLWDTELRGTKLIESKKIAAIAFKKTIVYGYPINLSLQTDARQPFTAAFSFNMVVKKHKLENIGSSFLDIRLFMNNRQRDQFDLGMKSLLDMENSLKELQEEYERGVVSGLSRDDLSALEAAISKKYAESRLEELG
jgi:hypothetical protein